MRKHKTKNKFDELASTFLTQDQTEVGVLLKNEKQLDYRESSLSSLLQKKLFEVKAVDSELQRKKEDYAERILTVKEGEIRFKKRQSEMRESIQSFERYILDSDSKRNRALRKVIEEKKAREHKELKVEKLVNDLKELKQKRKDIRKKLKRLVVYETYLGSVVYHEGQWESIVEVLNRHRVLMKAYEDHSESCSETFRAIEEYQGKLQKLQKEKTNEILLCNSHVARLLKTLELKTSSTRQAEEEAFQVEKTANETIRRLAQLQMAIRNLCSRTERSYEFRKPQRIQEDPSIKEESARTIQYLTRCLNEVAERIGELEWIVKDRPHNVTASKNGLPGVLDDLGD